MPKAEKEEKDLPETGDEAKAEAQPGGIPDWAAKTVEFLKKYQNVFYAAVTVVLLAWFIVKFRATQREKEENEASWQLSQATSVDALRALAEKYPDLSVTPVIHFTLANRLFEEQKIDDAIAEYEKTNTKWPDSLAGKLAGQRLKTARDNKAFNLQAKLDLLNAAAGEDKKEPEKPVDGGKPVVDDANLPVVEVETAKGKFTLELDEEGAPNVVANFLKLVSTGYYEKNRILAIEKDLAVTMGDPLPDGKSPRMFTLDFESGKLPAKAGVVAMVRDLPPEGQPDTDALKATASTHFVVFTGDAAKYEGKYLVFGRVTEGLDVVKQLTAEDLITPRVVRWRSHPYEPKRNAK